jgi:ribosomal protein S18 acetylase RimI-like enzyme
MTETAGAARVAGVTVRDATEADVEFLAWVMLAASRSQLERGIWEYVNDHTEAQTLDFLARVAVTDKVHVFHHSLFVIAEVDGEPAAAMCAYDSTTQGFDVYVSELGGLAGELGLRLDDPEFLRRSGVLMSGLVLDPIGPPGARWVVENVATKAEFRRRGLVDALLRELLDRGRAKGYSAAQIGVFIGNDAARRAYLKAGFEVVAEKRSPEWDAEIGCPGTELLLQSL